MLPGSAFRNRSCDTFPASRLGLCTSRLSVLLPATGAQSERLASSLAGQHMEQRVVTKLIVVVQVFIAEREGEHALADQGLDRVLEQSWVAPVGDIRGFKFEDHSEN